VRARNYSSDVTARPKRTPVVEVPAERGLVVEDAATGFCGAVVRTEAGGVLLEDARGARRSFPLRPGAFRRAGRPVTLVPARAAPPEARLSASGSVRTGWQPARVAAASRIWVEGRHDAELVERVWGHDLRAAGVVVEPMHGVDDLAAAVGEFGPGPQRRLGVLVDHLVEGSKESHIVASVSGAHVLLTGHPYVDIWQAVKPAALGVEAWPAVGRDTEWKQGVCAALGWGAPAEGWRRVLAGVTSYRDLESPLLGAVERLIDFVTAGEG
jgi:hypothetical protein